MGGRFVQSSGWLLCPICRQGTLLHSTSIGPNTLSNISALIAEDVMEFPLSLMGLLLVIGLLWSSAYTYLAWFKPDRLRTLRQPPKSIRRLLGNYFEFLCQESESDYALWVARLVGPLVTALILVLLIAMFLHASSR